MSLTLHTDNVYSIEDSIVNVDKDKIDAVNKDLLDRFIKTKGKKIAEEIIKINIPIVLLSVKRFGIAKHSEVYDDFVAEGLIELNNCINKYDPEKGKFSTYAFQCIGFKLRHLMSKYKDQVKTPPRVRSELKKLNDSLFLQDENPLSETDKDLLKLNFKFISNDGERKEGFENKDYSFDLQQYKNHMQKLESEQYAKDCYDILIPTLKLLSDRNQNIINKFFGINQKQESVDEIAKDVGISRQRVRQIKERVLKKFEKVLKLNLKDMVVV